MNESSSRLEVSPFYNTDPDFHFLAYPSHILVWMCDPRGHCDFVSPSWTAFTAREMKQELGHGWLKRVHPDDRDALDRSLADAIEKQQPFRLLYRYQRGDGIYRWFVNQGMVRRGSADDFSGYIGLCFDVTAFQDGESEIELSTQRMITLLQQTRLIAVVLDNEGCVLFSNASLCRLLQQDEAALMNARLFERYLAPDDRGLLQTLYPQGRGSVHLPSEFESALQAPNGEVRHVVWHAITMHESAGHPKRTILIGDDFTEARHEEDRLKLSASIIDSTNQAVVVTDTNFNIVTVNQAFTDLTGYDKQEVLGKNPRIFKSARHDNEFYKQMWKCIGETDHWRGDIWDRRKDGSIYPKFLSISTIRNVSGAITHYAGIFYEISERKAIEERLDLLAHYDALTGLPNRGLLLDRLQLAITAARRKRTKVGLLYLDLDHFKQVNDTLGHFAGDSLLRAAAQRLKDCVRAVDTVARVGGDEFVVLLPDIKKPSGCARVAQKILNALTPPYDIDGKSVTAAPSIGISVYPDDHLDMEILLRHADAAMYVVKQTQRGEFMFFHDIGHSSS